MALGKLIISTELDTQKFEKQLEQLEKEQNKLKDKKLKLELEDTKASNSLKQIENQLDVIDKKIADFKITNPADVENETAKYQELVSERSKLVDKADEYLLKINMIHSKQEEVNESLKTNATTIESIKNQLNGVHFNTENVKQGFDKLVSSAKKLAMGIIGVRTAYNLVRKMASAYMSDNEELTNRMSANWTALGTLMSGIIEGIVNGFKKAVTAILYFAQVLTGVNYIAKANAILLKKQAKATGDLTKANKKLSASFDEMEVLQDTNSSSGMGSSFKADLFDINDLSESAKTAIEKIGNALKPVYEIIKNIVDFAIKHPDIILGILGGLGILSLISKIMGIAGVGGTGLLGLYSTLGAIAAIGTIAIVIDIISNWRKEAKELADTMDKIRSEGQKIHDDFIKSETNIDNILENSNTKRETALELLGKAVTYGWLLGDAEGETYNTIVETSKQIDRNIQKEIELYNAGEKNESLQQRIKNEIWNQYQYNLKVIEALKNVGKDTSEIEELNKNLIQNYKDMGGTIDEANGKMTLLKDNSKITVEMDLNTKKAEAKSKSFWNVFTEPFKDLFSGIRAMFGAKGLTYGMGGRAKGGIYYPKLALGGIINRPGQGVPYHGAIIGERGAEAVVPLTDSQQMALLGEAIGKFITINATVVNSMNGRVLSREIQKVQNDSNFGANR